MYHDGQFKVYLPQPCLLTTDLAFCIDKFPMRKPDFLQFRCGWHGKTKKKEEALFILVSIL